MAMVFQSIFSLIGCIIIAFVFGWKLTLVAVFVALPIIMVGAFFRYRFEVEFEKMNQEVFAESSKVSYPSRMFRLCSRLLTLYSFLLKPLEPFARSHH